MTTKTLIVPDISCAHCERAIKGAVEPLAGVRSVAVDVPGKTVRVQYDEAAVSIDGIGQAVEEEDYPVASIA